jgi:molybdenum transport protein
MMPLIPDTEIDRWLAEDVPFGDLTTHALGIGERPGRMAFEAREAMVVAASEEAARLLVRGRLHGERTASERLRDRSGRSAAGGRRTGRRPAGRLEGGANADGIRLGHRHRRPPPRRSRTRRQSGVVVACTRKTFPGTKAISLKAILAAGAIPHRLGLSETVLVFPEHRAFLAGESQTSALARLKVACPERKIVVEVDSLDDAVSAARAGADVVQLEKLPPETVAAIVARLADAAPHAKVAAAGGVKPANAADYARAGAHILVTSAPYFAPPADIKVSVSAR